MNFKKSLLTLGLASAMAAPAAFAAPPVTFGGYTYNSATGEITSDLCAAGSGYTCSSQPIADNGFLQVQATDSAGNTYFQTIIVDPEMGGFTSEAFTTTGGNNGVAAQQTIGNNTSGTTGMSSVDTILTGNFFDPATEKKVDIQQSIWDQGSTYAASEFQADFAVAMGMSGGNMIMDVSIDQRLGDAAGATNSGFSDTFAFDSQMNETTGVMVGKRIDIDTGVQLNDTGTTNDQTFAFSSRMGTFTDLDGTSYGNSSGDVTVDNGDILQWAAGDNIAQVLIGSTVTGAGDFAFVRLDGNISTDGGLTYAAGTTELADLSTNAPNSLLDFNAPTAGSVDPF